MKSRGNIRHEGNVVVCEQFGWMDENSKHERKVVRLSTFPGNRETRGRRLTSQLQSGGSCERTAVPSDLHRRCRESLRTRDAQRLNQQNVSLECLSNLVLPEIQRPTGSAAVSQPLFGFHLLTVFKQNLSTAIVSLAVFTQTHSRSDDVKHKRLDAAPHPAG